MAEHLQNNLPTVSIICPTYNGQNHITDLIESLLALDYPQELIDIIVVDNNSQDRTREIIKQYPVTLLQETEIQSSYAARNRGIRQAKGEILAFIDDDCVAAKNWLREGVKALQNNNTDLVGGRVKFTLSAQSSAAEMYDAVTHFDFEKTIKDQIGTGSGNLFVWPRVFDAIGLFPDNVASGGDFQWTNRALQNDLKLVYAENAIIFHPTRKLRELLTKRYRTGRGTLAAWRNRGMKSTVILARLLRYFLPRRLSMIKAAIDRRGTADMKKKILRIWLIAYLCNLSSLIGLFVSICKPTRSK